MPAHPATIGAAQDLIGRVQELEHEQMVARRREAAVAEILRVINRSPSDIQPVLDAVARNAARLCDTEDASIFRRDGDQLVIVAHHGPMRQGPIGAS